MSGQTTKLAILFGYNGTGYSGLERTKGEKTIENELLTALATLGSSATSQKKVTFVGISRASTTEEGEHATRQTLSLEIAGEADPKMLDVKKVNELLPPHIRVYAIIRPTGDFSARRSCDARTYEYLLPTYVFSPPSPQTYYANKPIDEPIPEEVIDAPRETLFKTMRRTGNTLGRKQAKREDSHNSPPSQTQSPPPDDRKNTGTISKFFQSLKRPGRKDDVPSLPPKDQGKDEPEEPILATIKRSMSRKKSTRSRSVPGHREEEIDHRFVEEQEALYNAEPVFYDPLELPPISDVEASELRRYRMPQRQYDLLQHIVGLFRGTHNFHNYIPGANYEDPRCYMRILNIECSKPEEHAGMEWVRIKVQAKAFARFQIRKMISLAILIIRTNTPRAILGNSFGFAKIDIPEAPGHALILDESHYDAYNSQAAPESRIAFSEYRDAIEGFRKPAIHNAIHKEEYENMHFEEWVRSIDRYSFLYMYYLNSRGVIGPRNAFIREATQFQNPVNVTAM